MVQDHLDSCLVEGGARQWREVPLYTHTVFPRINAGSFTSRCQKQNEGNKRLVSNKHPGKGAWHLNVVKLH